MKKLSGFNALAMFISCTQSKREIPAYSIEQFFDNIAIFGGSFSTDGAGLLVTSNQTGIYNVFTHNVDGSGETQLTDSGMESRFAISCFPEDDILYMLTNEDAKTVVKVLNRRGRA